MISLIINYCEIYYLKLFTLYLIIFCSTFIYIKTILLNNNKNEFNLKKNKKNTEYYVNDKLLCNNFDKRLRLRGGGDHNVAHEKPEGCPYKAINVRRGNAMRFLVLDHIKEKPVRTKKALVYILSKDKRRAMENIAAQWLFHKVDAYPPEERFYPLHVKPVDDLYYIPEKKVEQMVYVVNKLKKASLESIVSDVTWEESSEEEDDEDYIVDLKTDKLRENADRCERTLEEIEKYYFEAEDGGEFSPREPGSPVGSEAPYRSIYESHSDTTNAGLLDFNMPGLTRTKSVPILVKNKAKQLKLEFKRHLSPFTQVDEDEDVSKSETDLRVEKQYAESHLRNKRFLEIPEVPETTSEDDSEHEKYIRKKITELNATKSRTQLNQSSSNNEDFDDNNKSIKKRLSIFSLKRIQSVFDTGGVGDPSQLETKPSAATDSFPYDRPMSPANLARHLADIKMNKQRKNVDKSETFRTDIDVEQQRTEQSLTITQKLKNFHLFKRIFNKN